MKTTKGSGIDDSKRSVYPLFLAGTLGWIVGLMVIVALSKVFSKPASFEGAMLWGVNHWYYAFVFGLLVLLGYGIMKRLPLRMATLAYVTPVAVIALLAWFCTLIYNGAGFKADLCSLLPIGVAFYVFAVIWMRINRDGSEQTDFSKAIMPTILGSLVILGSIAIPAFASNDFRYQKVFGFDVTKSEITNGELVCDAVITIQKPGDYHFQSARYAINAMDEAGYNSLDDYAELGSFAWGAAGKPGSASVGDFPVKISWKKSLPAGGIEDLILYEETVYLEVRSENAEGDFLYGLHDAYVP